MPLLASSLTLDELDRLDVPQRVQYKLGANVDRCLLYCIPISDIAHRQRLTGTTSAMN